MLVRQILSLFNSEREEQPSLWLGCVASVAWEFSLQDCPCQIHSYLQSFSKQMLFVITLSYVAIGSLLSAGIAVAVAADHNLRPKLAFAAGAMIGAILTALLIWADVLPTRL
jgi:hypothetical protein